MYHLKTHILISLHTYFTISLYITLSIVTYEPLCTQQLIAHIYKYKLTSIRVCIHIYICVHMMYTLYIYIQHNTAAAVISSTSAAMRRSSANSAWAKALEHFDGGSQRGWEKRGCDGIIMDIDALSYIYGI